MGGEVESIGIAEARSALAWWLEAGVDVALQEAPRDWLKGRHRRAIEQCLSPRSCRMWPSPTRKRSPRFNRGSQAVPRSPSRPCPLGESCRMGPKTPQSCC